MRVDPAPFVAWADAYVERHDLPSLLSAIGWTPKLSIDSATRKLNRWRHESTTLDWLDVYDALTMAGSPWWEIYPGVDVDEREGRVDRGRCYVCTEEILIEAHAMHLDGMSLRAVAAELFDDCFSASPKALANAFHNAFHRRGWEVRGRSEATARSNRARAFRPQCSHVHKAGEHRGERCVRQCVGNDTWCWRHHPDHIAQGIERLRATEVVAA